MKDETLFNLSYGMYAIGVKNDKRVSACIVNTVFQVTNTPNQIAISMNRNNYSHECIEKEGIFTVSVLSEDTSGAVIGALGFNSGRDTDKLKNIRHKILVEGLPAVSYTHLSLCQYSIRNYTDIADDSDKLNNIIALFFQIVQQIEASKGVFLEIGAISQLVAQAAMELPAL